MLETLDKVFESLDKINDRYLVALRNNLAMKNYGIVEIELQLIETCLQDAFENLDNLKKELVS